MFQQFLRPGRLLTPGPLISSIKKSAWGFRLACFKGPCQKWMAFGGADSALVGPTLIYLSKWKFSVRQKTQICQSGNFQFDKFVHAQVEIFSLTNLSRWHFPVRQKTNICQSGNFQFDKFVQVIISLINAYFTSICPLEIPILDQLHCPSGNFQFDKLVQVTTSLKNAYFTTICPLKIPILDQLQCKFARKFQNFRVFLVDKYLS